MSEQQLDRELLAPLQSEGAVAPIETMDTESTSCESNKDGRQSANIGNILAAELARMGHRSEPSLKMVQLVSEDESEEEDANVGKSSEAEFTKSAGLRQAERTKSLRDEQVTVRKALFDGCSPGQFSKYLPIMNEIRQQTNRDSAAQQFIDDIVQIAIKLEVINIALKSEQDPVIQIGQTYMLQISV